MEEKEGNRKYFSKEHCQSLIAAYNLNKQEHSLRDIINEVAKLDGSMACQLYMQDIMIELLNIFNNTRNELVDDRIVSFLKGIKWFRQTFDSDELPMRKFIKNFQVVKMERFSKIVRKGETSNHFYVLVSGRAAVLKEIELDKITEQKQLKYRRQMSFVGQIPNPFFWQQVHEMTDGDIFGDIGILYKRRRMATIVSKTNCVLIRIPAETFIQISAESTLKLHQKRLKFLCDHLSHRFRNLGYEELQHSVLQFEPTIYSYGSPIYKSSSCEHFLIIQEGDAMSCLYKTNGSTRVLQKRQLLSHGRFIGARQLLSDLNIDSLDMNTPQYESYLKKLKNSNNRSKEASSSSYEQIIAYSSQVRAYKVSKAFLLTLLKSHRDILCDIIDNRENGLDMEERPARAFLRTLNPPAQEITTQQCKISHAYKRMQNFIVRKKNEFRNREKQNNKTIL